MGPTTSDASSLAAEGTRQFGNIHRTVVQSLPSARPLSSKRPAAPWPQTTEKDGESMVSDLSLCRLGTTGSLLPSVRAQDPGFMDILPQNHNPQLGGLCVPQSVRGHVRTTLEGVGPPGWSYRTIAALPPAAFKAQRTGESSS